MQGRNYRAEAEALRRAEVHQLRALLLAYDVVENAVRAAGAILEPLRRPAEPEPEEEAHA